MVKAAHLSNYMQQLRNSGYSSKFRSEILLSTLSGFEKIQAAAKSGERPLYRKRNWKKRERLVKKFQKRIGLEVFGNPEFLYHTLQVVN